MFQGSYHLEFWQKRKLVRLCIPVLKFGIVKMGTIKNVTFGL